MERVLGRDCCEVYAFYGKKKKAKEKKDKLSTGTQVRDLFRKVRNLNCVVAELMADGGDQLIRAWLLGGRQEL